jgi:beta-glucanase (GH16 family)
VISIIVRSPTFSLVVCNRSSFHLNPGATKDLEWYDPDAITTKDGKLVITLTEQPSHGLSFRSGFLSSWNKLW